MEETDNKKMLRHIETALNYYDMVRKTQRDYYERLREKKKADGTYRGRGRPRKVAIVDPVVPPSTEDM